VQTSAPSTGVPRDLWSVVPQFARTISLTLAPPPEETRDALLTGLLWDEQGYMSREGPVASLLFDHLASRLQSKLQKSMSVYP